MISGRGAGIRAVVFDWGGTLALPQEAELIDLWRAAAGSLAPDRTEALTTALLEIERRMWARTTTTQRSARLMDLLREASDELGLDVAEAVLERAHEAHLDAWTPTIRHHPDAADVLRTVRAEDLRVGLLSNTHWPRRFHEQFLARDDLDVLIDQRLYTSEIDWMKPHPAPFERIAERLGVEPAHCVMVGDRPIDDIEGGRDAGMRTVWIRNTYTPGEGELADVVVDDLAEVPDAIAQLRTAAAGP